MMEEMSDCLGENLAPFNPSGDEVIRLAIEMLQLGKESILYDLGCGDGRLLTEAAKATGARGVGVEYDKRFADRAIARVKDAQLDHKIDIVHGNVLDAKIDDATAAFVYLVPVGMAALKDSLFALLKRGARVVTYGLDPVRVETYKATKIYLYTVASLENQP